jgi:hypothetical protein
MTTVPMTGLEGVSQLRDPDRRNVVRAGPAPYVLGGALAVIVGLAAAFTVAFPSLLHGAAVSNGNMRGTAVALLAGGLPVLIVAMIGTGRGSARSLVVWLGTLGYLIYQAVLLCFATPLNNLFLFYVAYLSLAVWSMVMLLRATDLPAFATRLSDAVPARVTAAAAFVIVVLNAGAWLSKIVPAVLSSRPTSVLDGTGLLTNPVYVQDLAVWLPLLAAAAVACWRRAPWGCWSPQRCSRCSCWRASASRWTSGSARTLIRTRRCPHCRWCRPSPPSPQARRGSSPGFCAQLTRPHDAFPSARAHVGEDHDRSP